MANFAKISAARRLGLTSDPMVAWVTDSPPAAPGPWLLGAALTFTSGKLQEAAVNPASILGFAADPSLQTGSAPPPLVDAAVLTAVGLGASFSGIRRRFYPATQAVTYVGTLGTSTASGGAPGDTALALTDVGSKFGLRPVNSSGVSTVGGTWILDRAAATTNAIAKVIALVDPIGAKETDTPVAGVNSGQALVEFVIINSGQLLYN